MDIEDAAAALKAEGFDYTVEELKAFSEMLDTVSAKKSAEGELDEAALGNVSGGSVIGFALGASIGYLCGRLAA